ncbi:MAG: alpha/beta hydrolase [Xanthomonadaceae bacterium]|nr:alpha/beta hydrolase [Xanthomonadaceae bacterium]MDP2186720.1 alpha/beta hydrolase [Xanthomonadales bacterium]MDZ4117552.1 alpha/beta hydrolase [Xanthomonadaceae bacterium]MDZ4377891.1 alpha/beta hydrolase [Xanthomonadaceae bacterium]
MVKSDIAAGIHATSQALRIHSADGLLLAAERWPTQGPEVLLAHGFGQTRQSWQGTAGSLRANGYSTMSFDARGHGESGRNAPMQRYQPEQWVADLHAITAQVSGPRLLIGASMGGLTGLMAQAEHALFDAMVLVDITPRWEAEGFARIVAFMSAHPDGFDDTEHAADAIAGYLPQQRVRKRPEQLASLLVKRDDGRLVWHWDPRMLTDLPIQSEPIQRRVVEAARQITVPLLLISGGQSDLVSEQTVAEFLELVPHAQHRRIDKASHMVAGDDNAAFTAAIHAFLASPAARAALCTGEHR